VLEARTKFKGEDERENNRTTETRAELQEQDHSFEMTRSGEVKPVVTDCGDSSFNNMRNRLDLMHRIQYLVDNVAFKTEPQAQEIYMCIRPDVPTTKVIKFLG